MRGHGAPARAPSEPAARRRPTWSRASFLRLCEEAGAARAGRPAHPLRAARAARRPGLGSSASAVVAGLLGANTLLGRPFDRGRPARAGRRDRGPPRQRRRGPARRPHHRGAQRRPAAHQEDPRARGARRAGRARRSPSARARRAPGCPPRCSMQDAVFNLGRTPLVVEALRTGDYELLQPGDGGPAAPGRRASSSSPAARDAWRRGAAGRAPRPWPSRAPGPSLIAFVSLATDAAARRARHGRSVRGWAWRRGRSGSARRRPARPSPREGGAGRAGRGVSPAPRRRASCLRDLDDVPGRSRAARPARAAPCWRARRR